MGVIGRPFPWMRTRDRWVAPGHSIRPPKRFAINSMASSGLFGWPNGSGLWIESNDADWDSTYDHVRWRFDPPPGADPDSWIEFRLRSLPPGQTSGLFSPIGEIAGMWHGLFNQRATGTINFFFTGAYYWLDGGGVVGFPSVGPLLASFEINRLQCLAYADYP